MHTRRVARWLPVLTIVATVFRPSLTIVMCAGLPIFLIWRRRLRWRSTKDLFWRFWLPGVAMLAMELAIAKTDSRLGSRSSVVIQPLGVFNSSTGSGLPNWIYWTTLAVIPAAAVVSGRRWYRDRAVQLTSCCLLAGLVPTMLVVQVGAEANDGNIAKLALIGLIMLTFASLRTMVDTTGTLIATPAPISIGSWARVITGWSVVWLGMLGGIVIVLYVSGFS